MQILDGKTYRLELLEEYKKIIEEENLDIRLDIIKIGDDPSSIQKKIRSAVTDSGQGISYDSDKRPAIANLLTIFSAFSSKSIDELVDKYRDAGNAQFKDDLADTIIATLEPLQKRYYELLNSEELDNYLDQGADKARRTADKTLNKMKNAVGLGRKRRK